MPLPTEAKNRKEYPLFRGLFKYFPDALCEVAHCSYRGNQQHHPDEPLHWDKSKSTDEADALLRHQMAAGTLDEDGVRHSAKVAWRALAQLQRELEAEGRSKPKSTAHRVLEQAREALRQKALDAFPLSRDEQIALIAAEEDEG